MREGVLRELDAGGVRLAPTAERIRKLVNSDHQISSVSDDTFPFRRGETAAGGQQHQNKEGPNDRPPRLMI